MERGFSESDGWTDVPLDWTTFDPALLCEKPPGFRLQDDLRDLVPEVRRDLASLVSWRNLLIVGAGAGVSLALRENVDGEVRAAIAESPNRLGDSEKVLNAFGDPLWQVPALLAGYGYSLWRQDEPFHQFMSSTIASYTYTGIAALTLKGLADTSRPSDHFQDGRWGFPSFHTASTFTIAANIETWYGWPAGVPALALAGLVGYSRVDAQEHDLSDVVFGAVLGYTIGKSVALSRQTRGASWRVDPWYDPLDSAGGVGVELKY
ncbi:MAG: phosphatase PAP2 family protein [Planctomycetaceae bacterium]